MECIADYSSDMCRLDWWNSHSCYLCGNNNMHQSYCITQVIVASPLIGVREMHGRIHPNYGLVTILLVVAGLPTLATS